VELCRASFGLLRLRLISGIRDRVRNGEISERRLAHVTGVSQPHIHHVLKGTRVLSLEMADQIIERLQIDLMELLSGAEVENVRGDATCREQADACECGTVPLLEGWIGPAHPYPRLSGSGRYPFAASDVAALDAPVAARLAPDPLRGPIFGSRGVVLLEGSERIRRHPGEEGYFALDMGGSGTIGCVRCVAPGSYLWAHPGGEWQPLSRAGSDPLDAIQGRVSLLVRPL
jgi:hypothetical protein